MKSNQGFVIGRLKSFKYAFSGACKLVTTEHSIMAQIVISFLITIAGFYFNISKADWMFQTIAIGLVLGTEGMNTAVEKLADFIHPEFHNSIAIIKDIAAGAVFFAAIAALIIGFMIYYPLISAL